MTSNPQALELQQLKRCVRDLVALTALPASWTGKTPEQIARLAAEMMLATFRLEVACVWLKESDIWCPAVHVHLNGQQTVKQPEELNRQLTEFLQTAVMNTALSISDPTGRHPRLQAIVLPIGHHGQFGCAMAASHLDQFPDAYELVLLEVCVNQTATALKEASLIAALRESNAELRRSNEDLAQYAYAASHDLQEPLRTITLYTQLLDRRYSGQLGETADETIKQIVGSAKRMEQLIRDVLSHSRLSAADVDSKTLVDTVTVVRLALDDLHEAVAETNASVTVDKLPSVIAEASQLRELFQNLIGNSIKYRAEDPPHIHIGAVKRDGEWHFSVTDNGQGFDPKYADQIFRVFTRLHSKQVPGTGMGLAICKKIVERHGGRIWAESCVGQGATFHFTLPDTEQGRTASVNARA
ncbi:MAG TPA: ATP-binding protein [Bryobacteraceae bacterium]|nr:ATP-binding protein [Bryobacteraceae bacterium]